MAILEVEDEFNEKMDQERFRKKKFENLRFHLKAEILDINKDISL